MKKRHVELVARRLREGVAYGEERSFVPPQPTTVRLLRVEEVCGILGVSRAMMHKLIHEEGFPIVRMGRSIRISEPALNRWINGRMSVKI